MNKLPNTDNCIPITDAISLLSAASEIDLSEHAQHIIDLALAVNLDNQNIESIKHLFFSNENTENSRLLFGVVETPKHIAAIMVSIALTKATSQFDKTGTTFQSSNLNWLDQSSGAGAFPIAILEHYLKGRSEVEISDLPRISICELSPLGLFTTLCSIKLLLLGSKLSLAAYIGSERLKCHLGDTLKIYGENNDLLSHKTQTFDVVIGNPPYVRATRLTRSYRVFLRKQFPASHSGAADLYTYFLASGLACLSDNGVLVYISPASFIRAKSGTEIRKFIENCAALELFLDLDEISVFPDADIHSAIYSLKKCATQQPSIQYEHISSVGHLNELCGADREIGSAYADISSKKGWAFHSSRELKTSFERKFNGCKSLSDFGMSIYSGIRPGLAKAFVLDEPQLDVFSTAIKEHWIHRIVLPANIKKWSGSKKDHFMIVVPNGTPDVPLEILAHLEPFKNELIRRAEVKGETTWFCLRACSYYSKMEKPKIVFPDLSSQQRFSLSSDSTYVVDGSYFIDTDSLTILGILNSSTAREYFVNRCSSVGSLKGNGRFRFKKTFVHDFPIPENALSGSGIGAKISEIVDEIIRTDESPALKEELDSLVEQLYSNKHD